MRGQRLHEIRTEEHAMNRIATQIRERHPQAAPSSLRSVAEPSPLGRSERTLARIASVKTYGHPLLVEAMNTSAITIAVADVLVKLTREQQAKVIAGGPTAIKSAVLRLRSLDAWERVRARVERAVSKHIEIDLRVPAKRRAFVDAIASAVVRAPRDGEP